MRDLLLFERKGCEIMIAKNDEIRQLCYVWPLREQMKALQVYAEGRLSWDELTEKLQEKITDEKIKKMYLLSYGARYSDTYPREVRLLEQVSRSTPEEAKALIEKYLAEPFEISLSQLSVLLKVQSVGPVFLEMLICPLPGYLLGRVPLGAIGERVKNACANWLDHPHRTVLEENYKPEYDLMADIMLALQDQGFAPLSGDIENFPTPEAEEAFRAELLKALEVYINADHERKQVVL